MGSESQLGEAFVPIRATLDKLDGDLAQARSKVEGAMKGMEDKSGKAGGALKALGTQVNNLKKQVPALGTAFNLLSNPLVLATAGVAAFAAVSVKSVKEIVDYNKTVREMMQVTGLSAEETSRLIQVADDWGIEIGEVRNALELMNKKGVTPSIDKLSQIADEFVSATDKSAFMEEATKKYGKSFGTLIPILAKGGTALKEQAASISDNLIATNESIDAGRKYEVAMDNLGDSVTGLKYKLGNELLPTIIKVTEGLNDLITQNLNASDAADLLRLAHKKGLITDKELAVALRDIRTGTKTVAQVTNQYGVELETLNHIEEYSTQIEREEAIRRGLLIPPTEELIKTTIDYQNVIGGPYREALERAHDRLTDVKNASRDVALAIEADTRQMGRLNEYINGTLGPNEEKFTTTQDELNTKMGEIQGEIDKAIKDGYDPLGEKVLELKGKYAELKGQYDENAAAHEEDTKRIILGILAQEMAAMGFSDSTAFAKIALDWGLIDEATMNTMMATDQAINWLRDHPGDYAGFEAMMNRARLDVDEVTTAADTLALSIDKITGQHEVGINVTVTGDAIPNIPSGVWKTDEPYIGAATGFEGIVRKPTLFMAGEAGSEYVNIMPQDLSNYKLPTMAMELKGIDIFRGTGMAMTDHKNQMQPAAVPLTINLYAIPGKEKDMRRQARYIADEFQRRGS
jgi:hypothetical protein